MRPYCSPSREFSGGRARCARFGNGRLPYKRCMRVLNMALLIAPGVVATAVEPVRSDLSCRARESS